MLATRTRGAASGRGLPARLLSNGNYVVGIARHRPDSWSGAEDCIEADIRDAAAVNRAVTSADVVAHFAWTHDTQERTGSQVNIAGTANVLAAMAETSARRIVFPSSPHVYGGGDTPRSEIDCAAGYFVAQHRRLQ
ncbi:NAD-dependent epimerase/dehydratase family protein [Mycobacterium avium]|uniref:NAD-dependent epimerase/dehydratase family protein n=1 Tax=Mycobacterium avium TaxID=1764 RepID=UPI003AFB738E